MDGVVVHVVLNDCARCLKPCSFCG